MSQINNSCILDGHVPREREQAMEFDSLDPILAIVSVHVCRGTLGLFIQLLELYLQLIVYQ